MARDGYFGTVVVASYVGPGFSLPFEAGNLQPSVLQKYNQVDEYRDAYIDYRFYRRIGLGAPQGPLSRSGR